MRQGAQGQSTGMTLKDGMGREVQRGSGWGTHIHPGLIHVNVWQKRLQYCKVISLQLKKKKIVIIVIITLGYILISKNPKVFSVFITYTHSDTHTDSVKSNSIL